MYTTLKHQNIKIKIMYVTKAIKLHKMYQKLIKYILKLVISNGLF